MNFPIKSIITFSLLLFSSALCSGYAQVVSGKVSDAYGALYGVNVYVKGTSIGTQTAADGTYTLKAPEGVHELMVSYAGYLTQEKKITLNKKALLTENFTLQIETNSLRNVEIHSKTKVDVIKEQAFEVEAVEIKELKNSSVNVINVLQTIPGVNICLLYTSPSPRDRQKSRMPSSA